MSSTSQTLSQTQSIIEKHFGIAEKQWSAKHIRLAYPDLSGHFASDASNSTLVDFLKSIGVNVEAAMEIPSSLLGGHDVEFLISGKLENARLVIHGTGARGLANVVIEIYDNVALSEHGDSAAFILLADRLFSGKGGAHHLGAYLAHTLHQRKPAEAKVLAGHMANAVADYLSN